MPSPVRRFAEHQPVNTTEWDDRIGVGLVAICDITELEVHYSTRSAVDRARLKAALDAHYVWCPMPEASTAADE